MNELLAKALVAIAGEINDPAKDAVNPHVRNKYASLDATIGAIRAVAAKYGVSIVQSPKFFVLHDIPMVGVTTDIIHESGASVRYCHSIPCGKPDPQGFGSALTYIRRYALQAIFNITGETDDDANSAQPANTITQRRAEYRVLEDANSSTLAPPDLERKYSKTSSVPPPEGDNARETLAIEINELARIIGEHKGQSPRDVIADASSFKDKDDKIVQGFTDPMELKRDGVTYKASLKWLGGTLKNMREYCKKNGIEVTE